METIMILIVIFAEFIYKYMTQKSLMIQSSNKVEIYYRLCNYVCLYIVPL